MKLCRLTGIFFLLFATCYQIFGSVSVNIIEPNSSNCLGSRILPGVTYPSDSVVTSYLWSANLTGTFDNTTIQNPTFISSQSGVVTFTCVVNFNSGGSESDTATWIVKDTPVVSISGTNPGCNGQVNVLTATISNSNVLSGNLNFLWWNGVTLNTTTVNTSGVYSCTVSDSWCVGSAYLPYTTDEPTISAGGDIGICQSNSPTPIVLSGSSVGGNANTGAWSITSLNPSNLQNGSLSNTNQQNNNGISNTSYTPPANYTGVITLTLESDDPLGPCGSVSATKKITVHPQQVMTGVPIQDSLCPGDTIKINPLINVGHSFRWTRNANIILGNNSTTLIAPTYLPGYYCFIDSGFCPAPQICKYVRPFTSLSIYDTAICANAFGKFILPFIPKYGYQWSVSTSSWLGFAYNVIPQVYPPYNLYLYVIDSITGCSNYSSAAVNVLPAPNIEAGNAISVCKGEPVQLIAISSTPNTTVEWDSITLITPPSTTNPANFTPLSSGIAISVATDAKGCKAKDTLIITVRNLPKPELPNDTSICLNKNLTITAYGGGRYFWSNGDTTSSTSFQVNSSGVLSVIVIDTNNCIGKDTVIVTPTVPPTIYLPNGDTSLCSGASLYLYATGANNIIWYRDSIPIYSSNSITYPTGNVMYKVVGYNVPGCNSTDSFHVNLLPLPAYPVLVDAPSDTFCSGQGGGIASVVMQNGINYRWASSPLNYADTTNSSSVGIFNLPSQSGPLQIYVYSVDANGCNSDTAFRTIFVSLNTAPPVPLVVLSPNGNTLVCIDNTMDTYQWGYDLLPGLTPMAINGEVQQHFIAGNDIYLQDRYYWVIACKNGCCVKSYYNLPNAIDQIGENTCNVYPNPFTNNLYIETTGTGLNTEFSIVDINGSICYAGNLKQNNVNELLLTDIATGFYFLILTDATLPYKVVKKIIKTE